VEGALGTVRLLLERGADGSATNFAGRTPLDCARDESTRIVMRITHVLEPLPAAAPPLRRSPGSAPAGAAAVPAAAPAAAAAQPQTAPQTAPADVTAYFTALSLPLSYAAALGCATISDLALLTEEDLREVNMKPLERRRLLTATALLAAAAPA
jgi:hypothetical protein